MQSEEFTQLREIQEVLSELQKSCRGRQFSDIVDQKGNQYVDLVMEGGGVLGIALVGYMYILETLGIRFLRVGGTSAGSINALLVASLGTPEQTKSEKILRILIDLKLAEFIDGNSDSKSFVNALLKKASKLVLILRGLFIIDELEDQLGLNPGNTFYSWLTTVLQHEGITSTRELVQRMNTLPKTLRLRNGKLLTKDEANTYLALVAADVTTETKADFPRMAPLYWRDPDSVNPALYVRASMSIPFFFEPLQVQDIPQGHAAERRWQQLAGYTGDLPKTCCLVDGGIMSNFPIDLFHRVDAVPTAPTFGVKLGSSKRRVRNITKPTQLAGAVFNSARHCLDYDFIARHPDFSKLVAHVDTGSHFWLNFQMSDDAKIDLFVRGARAARDFLVGFDWPEYKKLRLKFAKTFIG